MTHNSEHVIIHKVKAFLEAPIPGGGKRWHIAAIAVAAFVGGFLL